MVENKQECIGDCEGHCEDESKDCTSSCSDGCGDHAHGAGDMQQKYTEFQAIQQQMQQINQQLELMGQQMQQVEISKQAVEELGQTEVGKEVLAPIADGIFFKADLKQVDQLVVNVGSGVTVEKTVAEVVKLLDEQQQEISHQMIEGEKVMQDLNEKAMKIFANVEASQ